MEGGGRPRCYLLLSMLLILATAVTVSDASRSYVDETDWRQVVDILNKPRVLDRHRKPSEASSQYCIQL